MRIGILTLPLHINYGGILQAFALQTVLQRMGHKMILIDQDRDIYRNAFRQTLTLGKYILKRILLRKKARYFDPKKVNQERREREQYTQSFIDRHINTYKVRKLATDVPRNLDAIVVGSDQVWRHRYFTYMYHCGIENAFLKFAENQNIKRIAYAASFGTDDWEYTEEETAECARLLKLFDAVSVREATAVGLCKTKLGYNDAKHVLDPTMLLDKEDYIRLVNQANTLKSPGNMMCYMLDNNAEKQQLIERLAQERGLIPFYTNSQIDKLLPNCDRIQPPLEQWLRGFMDAEFVVTDSFHACVFSIIFGKPFLVIGNKERGMARFQSLLKMFSLEDHLISSLKEYNSGCSYEIDVNTKNSLEEYKLNSFAFLKESLK